MARAVRCAAAAVGALRSWSSLLANGERALVSGGPGGIDFNAGSITRIFGHTHPINQGNCMSEENCLNLGCVARLLLKK